LLGYGQADTLSADSYTNAVDIWSTGVITFLILTGETYFRDQRRLGQYAAGRIGFPHEVLLAKSISSSGCDFTKSLMAPEPKDRPGVKESMQHGWLSGLDPDTVSEIQR
jgi:calcium/calmodulin-dependent protein kinase I